MRSAVTLVLLGVLLVGACGGGKDGASETSVQSEQVEILTSVVGAATERAEPIATGKVLEGSPLGGSPFCVGGTIRDTHGSPDPEVALIARRSSARGQSADRLNARSVAGNAAGPDSDGLVDDCQRHRCLRGLRGSGEMEIVYDPYPNAPARGRYTGTVTH